MAGSLTAAVRNHWVTSGNSVRSPHHIESVIESAVDALVERGIDRSWIQTGRKASLPASFGLGNTRWDIVIIKDEISLGGIEFTAQSGTSARMNLSNRIHEATSRALAVRSSDQNGGLQPLLGLFIMWEQGRGASVQPRLEAALNQFLDDELYDEIAYTTCNSDAELREPVAGMSVQRFIDRFSRRLLARAVGPLEVVTPILEPYREVIEAARGEKKDYSLERVPKRGGQAVVFRGVHKASGIEIAFKRRLSQWSKAGARMGREIEIARILSAHPNVMPVLDFEAQHRWFIMPLADATAEEQFLQLKDPTHLHRMIKSVASALAEAHRHGWRHRDVKPQNILLLHGRWTLADWGTVRRPRGQTTFAGRTGAHIGTPGFAPPELFPGPHAPEFPAGPHDLSVPATDIYSLGRVAAWALTGQWPQANIPLIPAEEPWRTIVEEATHHKIERRPQSIAEFLAIIDREHRKAGRSRG